MLWKGRKGGPHLWKRLLFSMNCFRPWVIRTWSHILKSHVYYSSMALSQILQHSFASLPIPQATAERNEQLFMEHSCTKSPTSPSNPLQLGRSLPMYTCIQDLENVLLYEHWTLTLHISLAWFDLPSFSYDDRLYTSSPIFNYQYSPLESFVENLRCFQNKLNLI